MKRCICLCVCFALLTALAVVPVRAAPAPNPVLRVGLFTGSAALVYAPLKNPSALGFRFGYLDENRNFITLGATAEADITMLKNRNVYVNGSTYSDTAASGDLVGAYHDDYGACESRESAEARAAELRASGVPAFISYASGVYRVRAGSYAASDEGRVTGSKYCVTVVASGTADILFQYDGGEAAWLCVAPEAADDQKPLSLFRDPKINNVKYYGYFEYRRLDGNNLFVYNTLSMQDYIKGVVPNEMSASWPVEALKAQAVCAKSYALRNIGRHKNDGFDLCCDTHCQRYIGRNGASEHSDRAVDETYGIYMTFNGTVCDAVYHSSDGGATENSENVWVEAIPYLRAVRNPYEDLTAAYRGTWQYTYTNEMLTALLNAQGVPNTGVVDFYVEKYTDIGNVYSVAIVDSSGKKTVYSKESARVKLNYPSLGFNTHSMRYTVSGGSVSLSALSASGQTVLGDMSKVYAIDADGQVVPLPLPANIAVLSADGLSGAPAAAGAKGTYVVSGRGYGHNVGMSQWGAHGMAERGFGFEEILKHFYTGIEVSNAA